MRRLPSFPGLQGPGASRAFLDGLHLRRGVEAVIVLLLAIQIFRLVLILATPVERRATPDSVGGTAPDLAILQSFDPFFRAGVTGATAEAGTGGLTLFGVRVGGQDGGSAILGLADGSQVFASVGEQLDGDAVVESVAYDHVVLVRGGARTRLTFDRPADAQVSERAPGPETASGPATAPGAAGGAAPPRVAAARRPSGAAAPPGAAPTVTPAALMADATFRPRMRGLAIHGFTVGSRGDGAALRALGLQPGDVITAVNGKTLNTLGRIGQGRADLQSATSAEIRYERDGETRTLTLGAPR